MSASLINKPTTIYVISQYTSEGNECYPVYAATTEELAKEIAKGCGPMGVGSGKIEKVQIFSSIVEFNNL